MWRHLWIILYILFYLKSEEISRKKMFHTWGGAQFVVKMSIIQVSWKKVFKIRKIMFLFYLSLLFVSKFASRFVWRQKFLNL